MWYRCDSECLERAKSAEQLEREFRTAMRCYKQDIKHLQSALKKAPKIRSTWYYTSIRRGKLSVYDTFGRYVEFSKKGVKIEARNRRKGVLLAKFLAQETKKAEDRCNKFKEIIKQLREIQNIKGMPDIEPCVKAEGVCRYCKQEKPVWAMPVYDDGEEPYYVAVICSDCYEKFCLLEMKKRVEGLRP